MRPPAARPRLGAHAQAGAVHFAAFARASSCAVALVDSNGGELGSIELEDLGGGYFSARCIGSWWTASS
jgi:hypothetical protein